MLYSITITSTSPSTSSSSIAKSFRSSLFSLLMIIACNLTKQAIAETTPAKARIIDGTRVSAIQFSNVTPVLLPYEGLCTGTLVSPRFVLTAAHCFFGEDNRREVGDKDVQVIFAGQTYRSNRVHISPSYKSRAEACNENELDGALIELSSDVVGITPAILSRSAPNTGQTITLAGYGLEGTGAYGESDLLPPYGILNFGYTKIEAVSSTFIQWIFNPGESNTAGGDSGGPSFLDVSGHPELVAITCGGGGNAQFGTDSFNTRIDRLASWIDSVAGTSPTLSAPIYSGATNFNGIVGQSLTIGLNFAGSAPSTIEINGLPPGLQLSGNSIQGTPQQEGVFKGSIVASNEVGANGTEITFTISTLSTALNLHNVLLQFNRTRAANDFLILKGRIATATDFNPRGKLAQVQIGNYKRACKLDASGGCGDLDFFQLKGKRKIGVFSQGTLNFELQLVNRKLFNSLATMGFPKTSLAKPGNVVSLPVQLTVNGITYAQTIALKFRSSDKRWVKAG